MRGPARRRSPNLLLMLGALAAMLLGTFVDVFSSEFQSISPEELKKLIETKANTFVVDVQPKIAYEIGHIKGAINFPWESEIKGPVALPKDTLLILYCDCADEEDSTHMAEQLSKEWGYKRGNIKLLKGGWSGWLKMGYPVDKKIGEKGK